MLAERYGLLAPEMYFLLIFRCDYLLTDSETLVCFGTPGFCFVEGVIVVYGGISVENLLECLYGY